MHLLLRWIVCKSHVVFSSKENASVKNSGCNFKGYSGNTLQFSSVMMSLSLLLYVAVEVTLRYVSLDILGASGRCCLFVTLTRKALQWAGG